MQAPALDERARLAGAARQLRRDLVYLGHRAEDIAGLDLRRLVSLKRRTLDHLMTTAGPRA